MSTLQQPTAIEPGAEQTQQIEQKIDWTGGWRYEEVQLSNGKWKTKMIPLTDEEIKHPKEEYVMPVRSKHAEATDDLGGMLRGGCDGEPGTVVFQDLIFEWDRHNLKDYSPDIALVRNVRNPEVDRSRFVIAEEGTRPDLIIEIVSPRTRKTDRVDKVRDYALAGVKEYIFIDHTTRRGQEIWEIAGWRLDNERDSYLPILIDEDNAVYCETIDMRIGIEDGRVWVEDGKTGENLLNNLEVRHALQQEKADRQAAEEARRIAEEERRIAEEAQLAEREARRAAESRIAELEAQLKAQQEQPK